MWHCVNKRRPERPYATEAPFYPILASHVNNFMSPGLKMKNQPVSVLKLHREMRSLETAAPKAGESTRAATVFGPIYARLYRNEKR